MTTGSHVATGRQVLRMSVCDVCNRIWKFPRTEQLLNVRRRERLLMSVTAVTYMPSWHVVTIRLLTFIAT